ncbi:MAG TPA: HNH endonuclease signature motif containing protein [Mycobacteriales bacterium]|nr:HNH endonuclease signature motif containing protein [Mycobacteriales bacterium]
MLDTQEAQHPDPALAQVLAASSPQDLDDSQLVDAIVGWERLAAWVAAGQLAAIAELARRRPPGGGGPGGCGGSGVDGHGDAGHPGHRSVSEFAVDEVSAALRLSRTAAGNRIHVAIELAGRVTTQPTTGAVLHAARTPYTPSAALADLIRARDITCRFPGCRRPAARCDLDHVTPWPAGPTAEHNIAAECRHHHRLKHQAGWRVEIDDNARMTWTSPTGHRYHTDPPAADPPTDDPTTDNAPGTPGTRMPDVA